MTFRYDDIVEHKYIKSGKRPKMSMADRAARFAPFAALPEYGEAVAETARRTEKQVILTEDEKMILDEKLSEALNTDGKITVTYFVPDIRKEGGSYKTVTGKVKLVDEFHRCIVLDDMTVINMDDIYDIS